MSYARFSEDSDVYVFLHVAGGLTCCGCSLQKQGVDPAFARTESMLHHLREHQQAGHKVPRRTFERLEADRHENDLSPDASAGRRAGL